MSVQAFVVEPLEAEFSFRAKAYEALRAAIMRMNIYDGPEEIRLDERQLASDLGVSRTPIREAMARLEHEGLVRSVPRRGIFVVRKSKREIVEMIQAWAALESMAARLITQVATDAEISSLRGMFATFTGGKAVADLDEYSEANIEFHRRLIELSGNHTLNKLAGNLFLHVRSSRHKTIGENDRASRSIVDHMEIVEALERRDTDRAEHLVKKHTLDLADHVSRHFAIPGETHGTSRLEPQR